MYTVEPHYSEHHAMRLKKNLMKYVSSQYRALI